VVVLVEINQLSYRPRYSIFSPSPVDYKRLVRDPEALIDAVLEDIEGQKDIRAYDRRSNRYAR